jgi:hypothetical protein
MDEAKQPAVPTHPEPRTHQWSSLERAAIERYDAARVAAALAAHQPSAAEPVATVYSARNKPIAVDWKPAASHLPPGEYTLYATPAAAAAPVFFQMPTCTAVVSYKDAVGERLGAPAAAAPPVAVPESDDPHGIELFAAKSSIQHLSTLVDDLRAEIAAAVPAGWVLVPIEPTPEMLGVYHSLIGGLADVQLRTEAYQAMLDAVPVVSVAGKPAEPMTAERIDYIAELVIKGMPDGLRGFTKVWGWQQFARALLDVVAPAAARVDVEGV